MSVAPPVTDAVGGSQAKVTGAFAAAVETGSRHLAGPPYAKEPYLRPMSILPVQAVVHGKLKPGYKGQADRFGDECEGHWVVGRRAGHPATLCKTGNLLP